MGVKAVFGGLRSDPLDLLLEARLFTELLHSATENDYAILRVVSRAELTENGIVLWPRSPWDGQGRFW